MKWATFKISDLDPQLAKMAKINADEYIFGYRIIWIMHCSCIYFYLQRSARTSITFIE